MGSQSSRSDATNIFLETGDAGGNDGDRIFINQGSAARTQMTPNHGHTSRIERQQFGRDLQGAAHDPSEIEQLNQGNAPCPLPWCTLSACAPDHNCHNSANGCKKKVHNLCYQASNLCAEEEEGTFFCSRACKQQKQAEQAERNKENTQKQTIACS